MNLASHIEKTYGMATAKVSIDLFDKLALPLPEDGEFTVNFRNNYLLFLNPVGCVIRLSPASDPAYLSDPSIQRPLATLPAEELRLDINPGMICPIDPRDVKALYDRYKSKGMLLWDGKAHNFGYRPDADDPDKFFPVLIDHDSVQQLSSSVSMLRHMVHMKTRLINEYLTAALPLKEAPPEATKEDAYEGLRAAFSDAWANATINQFWDATMKATSAGLLKAGWLTRDMSESGYKNAFSGSQLYAQRWQHVVVPVAREKPEDIYQFRYS